MSIPIGLQLYSLREAAAQDFASVLKTGRHGLPRGRIAGYGGLKSF